MSYMKENLKKQSQLVACLQCLGFVDREIKNQVYCEHLIQVGAITQVKKWAYKNFPN